MNKTVTNKYRKYLFRYNYEYITIYYNDSIQVHILYNQLYKVKKKICRNT